MPDGTLQTQPVWFDHDGRHVRMNTMRGFRKERNMCTDPRVALLVIDPDRPGRWLEIRGYVELDETGALAHLDRLARRYTGASRYFGECVPAAFAEREFPVLVRLTPTRVVTETAAKGLTCGMTRIRHSRVSAAACRGAIAAVPADHLDLLRRPLSTVLSTSTPDGQPRTQPVSSAFDGSHVRIPTARERRWARDLERDPHATVLVVDPADGGRWIELRGLAELSATCRIHPLRVVCDAIHRPIEPK